jgi:stage V sporulation protein S
MDIIKVAGNSRTSAVAGAIAGVFRENHRAEVQAIGAGAVNQAVKAMVLACSYLERDGLQIAFIPEFSDVDIDGQIRTAIKMYVEEHDRVFVKATPQDEDEYDDDDDDDDDFESEDSSEF